MNYEIAVFMDAVNVSRFSAEGKSVVMVKHVATTPSSPDDAAMVWVTFPPMSSMTVAWSDAYLLYGEQTVEQGAVIVTARVVTPEAAVPGATYDYADNTLTRSGDAGGTAFWIHNKAVYPPLATFGVSQQAFVEGRAVSTTPNALTVPAYVTVSLQPTETVAIFMAPNGTGPTVEVPEDACVVVLSSSVPQANVVFDDESQTFVQK